MKIRALFWLLLAALAFPMDSAAQKAQNAVAEFEANGVKFKMIMVEGGPFRMSEDFIAIVNSYYIGETEVTQELWKAVMGKNPSKTEGAKHPVDNVSWNDCQEFIQKLNEITGKKFRLPTEAEWTYAAIGGKKSKGFAYSGSNKLNDVAWWERNNEAYINFQAKKGATKRIAGKLTMSEPQDVATRQPNELGLYDMTGNVWEWCQDWYKYDLPSGQQLNPTGPAKGKVKVYKGGSWHSDEDACQIAFRDSAAPTSYYEDLGFRLVIAK